MTTKQRATGILLALIILAVLTLGCTDWDGMDRRGWSPPAPTPTCTVCRPDLPPRGD